MFIAFGIISSTTFHILLKRENARRDRGERDEIIGDKLSSTDSQNEKNGRFATVEEAKREKGDEWSGYRYILWDIRDWLRFNIVYDFHALTVVIRHDADHIILFSSIKLV